jgi:hypothetical protein
LIVQLLGVDSALLISCQFPIGCRVEDGETILVNAYYPRPPKPFGLLYA